MLKRCSGCRKAIKSSEDFVEISAGRSATDGTGWIMEGLKRWHEDCTPHSIKLALGREWRILNSAAKMVRRPR